MLYSSQCTLCKEYCAQHCPLVMLEKFKESLVNGQEFGALLADHSKVFDYYVTCF